MNRRQLLAAAPAVALLAGTPASPAAAAASSPILDSARQIAALGRRYDQADVPGANMAALDAIWQKVWKHEAFILDAAPATILEATAVVLVAAGNLDMASGNDDNGEMVNRAMRAMTRATRFLASTAGATVEEIGGGLYLPESAASPCMVGRA